MTLQYIRLVDVACGWESVAHCVDLTVSVIPPPMSTKGVGATGSNPLNASLPGVRELHSTMCGRWMPSPMALDADWTFTFRLQSTTPVPGDDCLSNRYRSLCTKFTTSDADFDVFSPSFTYKHGAWSTAIDFSAGGGKRNRSASRLVVAGERLMQEGRCTTLCWELLSVSAEASHMVARWECPAIAFIIQSSSRGSPSNPLRPATLSDAFCACACPERHPGSPKITKAMEWMGYTRLLLLPQISKMDEEDQLIYLQSFVDELTELEEESNKN